MVFGWVRREGLFGLVNVDAAVRVFDGFVDFHAGNFVVGGDDEGAPFELGDDFVFHGLHVLGHLVDVNKIGFGNVSAPEVTEVIGDFGAVYPTLSDAPESEKIDAEVGFPSSGTSSTAVDGFD